MISGRYVDRVEAIERLRRASLSVFEDVGLRVAIRVLEKMNGVTIDGCATGCATESASDVTHSQEEAHSEDTLMEHTVAQVGCDTNLPVKNAGVTVSHIKKIKEYQRTCVCACAHEQGRSLDKP